MRRVKWALVGLCLLTPTLHAWNVSYGSYLKITGITRTEGRILLPVERKKFYNVRILSQNTYQFVRTCQPPCRQAVTDVNVDVLHVRAAKEQPDMWIATVAFNQDWQGTFLVFRRGDTYSVKPPAHLIFLQQALKQKTEAAIIAAIKELK